MNLTGRPQGKSYVWLMRSGEDRLPPIVLVPLFRDAVPGEHARTSREGIADGTYVMADGYSGYNKLKKYTEDAVVTPISGDI
ncbi:MAG: IS66 family transposase [Enterocloster sp.]